MIVRWLLIAGVLVMSIAASDARKSVSQFWVSGASWGTITGTLNSQTDLQTVLAGKQPVGAYVTGVGTVSGTNTGDQTIALTGNVTGSGTGSFAATIANSAVTLAKMADMTTASILGRNTGGTGAPEVLSVTTTKTMLALNNVDNTADASKSVSSANTLTTPRTIQGVSFNGSANITIPAIETTVVTGADTTNATTSYANITGMVFAVAASTRYRIDCTFPYDANATTTGIGIGWTGPASPTLTRGAMVAPITTQTVGGTVIVGNDTGATTTASPATTNNVATFQGIWSNGSNAGTIQMRVKSEVAIANAIIVRAGAACSYAVY